MFIEMNKELDAILTDWLIGEILWNYNLSLTRRQHNFVGVLTYVSDQLLVAWAIVDW